MIKGEFIFKIILSSLPVILSGTANMAFVKSNVLQCLKQPIDGNRCLKDGRRALGDNKTYKGFLGMILFTAMSMTLMGLMCKTHNWLDERVLFQLASNGNMQNFMYGAIWGLGYVLFELPNSFIKRRLGIGAGKAGKGMLKIIFMLIDQVDSVLAGTLLILYFNKFTVIEIIEILIVGSLVHYMVNVFLYYVKLKKQRG